jgi:hypothetical protein
MHQRLQLRQLRTLRPIVDGFLSAAYQQMVAEAHGLWGKDDCLIVDLVGNTTRHDVMTAASLAGGVLIWA